MTELQIMKATSPLITHSPSSPSFNSYSSGALAEIAARVVQEFAAQDINDDDIFSWEDQERDRFRNNDDRKGDVCAQNNDDDDFEFAVVCREPDSSSISADEIFYNGQIRPIYPLFDTNLLLDYRQERTSSSPPSTTTTNAKPARLPLRKLFKEETELMTTSCSSSEADELDGVPSGSYCVWNPKKAAEAEDGSSSGRCKKSNSTGNSSKRWKFRDLLHRSNSEGREHFVFLTPTAGRKKSGGAAAEANGHGNNKEDKEKGNSNLSKKEGNGSVVEEHYVRSRGAKEGDKRRSFLPYRQDLVGFFSNVNGLSKNLHPF